MVNGKTDGKSMQEVLCTCKSQKVCSQLFGLLLSESRGLIKLTHEQSSLHSQNDSFLQESSFPFKFCKMKTNYLVLDPTSILSTDQLIYVTRICRTLSENI